MIAPTRRGQQRWWQWRWRWPVQVQLQLPTVQTQIADVRLRRFMAPACNVATNVIIVKCLVSLVGKGCGEGMQGGSGYCLAVVKAGNTS